MQQRKTSREGVYVCVAGAGVQKDLEALMLFGLCQGSCYYYCAFRILLQEWRTQE